MHLFAGNEDFYNPIPTWVAKLMHGKFPDELQFVPKKGFCVKAVIRYVDDENGLANDKEQETILEDAIKNLPKVIGLPANFSK